MKLQKERLILLLAAATALVVVALAGAFLWRPLADGWRLRRQSAIEDPLLRSLESGDAAEKEAAAARLGELKSERAIRPLVAMLRSWGKTAPTTTGMVEIHYTVPALTAIGPPAGPALREALRDENELVRLNAGLALAQMGAAAVPDLLAVLAARDLPLDARANAALALGLIRPTARAAIPALLEALLDDEKRIRDGALYGLSSMGPEAAPLIREALAGLTPEARQAAAGELDRLQARPDRN